MTEDPRDAFGEKRLAPIAKWVAGVSAVLAVGIIVFRAIQPPSTRQESATIVLAAGVLLNVIGVFTSREPTRTVLATLGAILVFGAVLLDISRAF